MFGVPWVYRQTVHIVIVVARYLVQFVLEDGPFVFLQHLNGACLVESYCARFERSARCIEAVVKILHKEKAVVLGPAWQ